MILTTTSSYAAEESKISAEIWENTKNGGIVSVMVELRLPSSSCQAPSKDNIPERKTAIASIQRDILMELNGSNHKVRAQLTYAPHLSLQVVEDALRILERSALVTGVEEIRKFRPL